MNPTCVDLRSRFGRKYRLAFDPAAESREDPWMLRLVCQRGTIYAHGGDVLAVDVDGRPQTARRLAALPGVVLHQDGDRGKTFLFPLDQFAEVAAIVKPKRLPGPRQLTTEHKAKLAVAGANFRFRPGVQSIPRPHEPPRGRSSGSQLVCQPGSQKS